MSDIIAELRAVLGDDGVLDAAALRTRARNYWDPAPLEALALVRPRTTEELSAAMRCCHARGQTVVPHGGRTGVCDGDRATNEDVIVSLERLCAIEEIDPVGRTATVQAGCRLQELQEAAEQADLYFPLDLGARGSCTVGGNVATNAGGINVIRYGMMRGLVLGLEAVLADGTVVSSLNRMLKNNSGFDLKQLFIGTEGTLGVVTRVIVTLKERPLATNTVLVAIEHGAHLARLLKEMDRGLNGTMSSFEVMWGDYFRAVTAPGRHTSPMDGSHPFYVIVEARGADAGRDAERFEEALEGALQAGLIADAVVPKSAADRRHIWSIRENFAALLELKPLFLYDISLPLRDMLTYVEEVRARLLEEWPNSQLFVLGHIGDGNLHFFVAPGTDGALHERCDDIVYTPLGRCGGAISAEHGIGLEKKNRLAISRSRAEIELMRTLKRALDPKNILNPGKVIDHS